MFDVTELSLFDYSLLLVLNLADQQTYPISPEQGSILNWFQSLLGQNCDVFVEGCVVETGVEHRVVSRVEIDFEIIGTGKVVKRCRPW